MFCEWFSALIEPSSVTDSITMCAVLIVDIHSRLPLDHTRREPGIWGARILSLLRSDYA